MTHVGRLVPAILHPAVTLVTPVTFSIHAGFNVSGAVTAALGAVTRIGVTMTFYYNKSSFMDDFFNDEPMRPAFRMQIEEARARLLVL
jgi:hypothetical protein